jgi:cytochrome P450
VLNHPRQVEHVLQDNSRNCVRKGVLYDSLRAFSGDGLIGSDGEVWLRQRRMIQPHFHRRQLTALTNQIVATIAEEFDAWVSAAEQGTPIDLVPAYARITMKVIVRALFGTALADAEIETLSTEIAYVLDHLGTGSRGCQGERQSQSCPAPCGQRAGYGLPLRHKGRRSPDLIAVDHRHHHHIYTAPGKGLDSV